MLRPFIVTYWSGRTTDDAPPEVAAVIEAARFTHQHINLALFALDADGKLLRSLNPEVKPGKNRFDPESQGRDFHRQLQDMLANLTLPAAPATNPSKLALPDVKGADALAGARVYLTFGANRLNHYRTPTVEAVSFTDAMRSALQYPEQPRTLPAAALRPLLEQLYPPAIMDGHGGCRRIDGTFRLSPAGDIDGKPVAMLTGTVAIELDNEMNTKYEGPLSIVVSYAKGNPAAKSMRGVGAWEFPKYNPNGEIVEKITMTAAIESRPD